jgi:hypothetical protein
MSEGISEVGFPTIVVSKEKIKKGLSKERSSLMFLKDVLH